MQKLDKSLTNRKEEKGGSRGRVQDVRKSFRDEQLWKILIRFLGRVLGSSRRFHLGSSMEILLCYSREGVHIVCFRSWACDNLSKCPVNVVVDIYCTFKSNMDKVQAIVRLWKGFETRMDATKTYANQRAKLVAQACPTLCNSTDCKLPGSYDHSILQARILKWRAITFSRGSSWPRDWTQIYWTAGKFFIIGAIREAHEPM